MAALVMCRSLIQRSLLTRKCVSQSLTSKWEALQPFTPQLICQTIHQKRVPTPTKMLESPFNTRIRRLILLTRRVSKNKLKTVIKALSQTRDKLINRQQTLKWTTWKRLISMLASLAANSVLDQVLLLEPMPELLNQQNFHRGLLVKLILDWAQISKIQAPTTFWDSRRQKRTQTHQMVLSMWQTRQSVTLTQCN